MFRIIFCCFVIFHFNFEVLHGQIGDTISIHRQLQPIEIYTYFSQQPILEVTSSIQHIDADDIESQHTHTLLPSLNNIAGLRMEERSPGSYRLAMRGSLIRSAFGIRNIKVYIDEFIFTDAGGNTYLNLIDPASIASTRVLKGPDGSLYGANSGGVIHIQPKGFDVEENNTSALFGTGSFGLMQEQFSLTRKVNKNYSFSFDQSFTRSNGYREHTKLVKKTFQTAHQWQYSKNNLLKILALYTDLEYQTPGGLTKEQMLEYPRMSRPALGTSPSAKEQNAGIYNSSFFGGIHHKLLITKGLSHTFSLFGSYTDFENPFLTNYEFRKEKNLGVRSYFSYRNKNRDSFQWEMQIGFENQKAWNYIRNYDNNKGKPSAIQAIDKLDNSQSSFFYRNLFKLYQRWTIETSIGLNQVRIFFHEIYPEIQSKEGEIDFDNIWIPRIASSYLLLSNLAIRGSISKGYSPPTIAEVRSSDNIINTSLEPETGINYEVGFRWELENRRFITDFSFYTYHMNNGIVRQLRNNGAEYFLNAGKIKQKGIEASFWYYILAPQHHKAIDAIRLQSSITYHHYRFGEYKIGEDNFTKNKVTAVPDWIWVSTINLDLTKQISINFTYNYTSSIPLNDANSVFSSAYHLLQLKTTWEHSSSTFGQIKWFGGIDNLLNQSYSLGNDINAFGERYFNPAPKRNYYIGVKIEI